MNTRDQKNTRELMITIQSWEDESEDVAAHNFTSDELPELIKRI
jgi:hypothetical protein